MRDDEIAIEAARRMADAGLNAGERKARRAEFEAGVSAEAREAAETAGVPDRPRFSPATP